MPYRTVYEITDSLPQALWQAFSVAGFPMAGMLAISIIFSIVGLYVYVLGKRGGIIRRVFGIVFFGAWGAYGIFVVVDIYWHHCNLANRYIHNSPNVQIIEGTISNLHNTDGRYGTETTFILAGKNIRILPNALGFNNALDPSLHDGAKVKIWSSGVAGNVVRLDVAEL